MQIEKSGATLLNREPTPRGAFAACGAFHIENKVPGGMISNLRSPLQTIGTEHRRRHIHDESAWARHGLGPPFLNSPFARFFDRG